MKLTIKQQRFVDYYIETGNATESAIRAGYSKKTARSIGQENLTKPDIIRHIEARNKQIENERIANMQEVKQFWTETMRDGEAEMRDRLKASEMIAKTNGAFIERVEARSEVVNKHEYHIEQRIINDPESAELLKRLYKRAASETVADTSET